MDFPSFVVGLVHALAWPATIITLVILLRKPLSELIPLLQRVKYKDLEIEFGERLEEARAEVLPSGEAVTGPSAAEEKAAQLAAVSPRAAVLETWRELEVEVLRAAKSILKKRGDDSTGLRAFRAFAEVERSQEFDRSVAAVLRELRMLRNKAAHAPDFAISAESAIEYARVADQVLQRLKESRT